ncbi:MFS transporter [Falsirhodobacter sp. 20TX0035]|uniref:MFS transporter n=1 Tax=Falsirhodobacter sp. 20TX0035 TaxID=3022019 RepID=UPI00232D1298|nr:MFS transporter [Falsirhodobacter sp. 20TX0035]MDB6453825.1 MFS transporter [Falsirhodobacter sp. 20TX0035]
MRHASLRAMTVFGTLAAIVFALGAAIPTPLYALYQQKFGLVPFQITLIFAIYVVTLLVALLTGGRLSNHLGRKPVIAGALILNIVALVLFLQAGSYEGLLLARAMQGLAMGIAVPTCGAAIVDADPDRGPVLNSIVPFLGMSSGALATGLLVAFAPLPTVLPFAIVAGLSLMLLVALIRMPETSPPSPGAFTSMIPSLGVPAAARPAFARLVPPVLTGWALGGLYMSLMPNILHEALHTKTQLITGALVCAQMGAAAAAVLWGRTRPASRMMMAGTLSQAAGVPMTLMGIGTEQAAMIFAGTLVSGAGQGLCFSSILRLLLPLAHGHERAAMLSTFFALSYTAFALPAVLAGVVVPHFGLIPVAHGYGLIVLALLTLAAMGLWRGVPAKRC